MNETRPYDQAGHELVRLYSTSGVSHVPCHWVFDQRQLDRDSIGGDPSRPPDPAWLESGALKKADTLELADLIEVRPVTPGVRSGSRASDIYARVAF
ncbi:hypothetical protein ABT255_43825 [Streptomyces mirabilis]|uniref:hypothetical protein n=1 Tax=Streptomyces mirabilis TaxID=68239 RepID=UPI00331DF10D